jgi:hypothetical protein
LRRLDFNFVDGDRRVVDYLGISDRAQSVMETVQVAMSNSPHQSESPVKAFGQPRVD